MGPIDNALKDIRHRIHKEVLEEAFNVRNKGNLVSIDYLIKEAVIEDRVRIDCDITGGEEQNIPLSDCVVVFQDARRTIFTVPHKILQGRKIISTISASYQNMNVGGSGQPNMNPMSPMGSNMQDMLGGNAPPATSVTTDLFITGENTFMVEGVGYGYRLMSATVIVSYDDSFSNIPPRAWPTFSNMVYEAVRAYCYIQLDVIKTRRGLVAGTPLGRIESIIESYSDAEEKYQEFVKTIWPKVALLSNDRRRKNHIDLITGSF